MKILTQLIFTLSLLVFSITSQAAIKIQKVYPSKITLTQGQSFQLRLDGQSLKEISRAIFILKARGEQKPIRLPLNLTGNNNRVQLELKTSQTLPLGNYVLYVLDNKNRKVKVPVVISLQRNSNAAQSKASQKKHSAKSSIPSTSKARRSAKEKTSRSKAKQTRQSSQDSTRAVTAQSEASRAITNRSIKPNSRRMVDAPAAKRIKITSFSVNEGAQNTDDRLLRINIQSTNGSIKFYRICDANEGPTRQDCDVTQQPWLPYRGQTISYLLKSVNVSRRYGEDEPRKRLSVQIKGRSLASSQINNVSVNNFSTIKIATISYLGQPVLDSFPGAMPQHRLSAYEFSISNIRAHHMTGEVRSNRTNCRFGLEETSSVYQADKQSDKQFNFRLLTIGKSTIGALSCDALILVRVYDKDNQEIEILRLQYNQQFLPYESRSITLENTAEIVTKLAIKKQTLFLSDQGYTICKGFSVGTSGRKRMGVLVENGDIVFSTRSSNLGRTCAYSIKARIKRGWLLTMNFEQVKDGKKCEVSQTGSPLHIAPMKLAFTRGKRFVGWERVFNIFEGTRESGFQRAYQDNRSTPTVFLTCKPTLSNNSGVKSIIKSVVFEVPPDAPSNATWQDAFN